MLCESPDYVEWAAELPVNGLVYEVSLSLQLHITGETHETENKMRLGSLPERMEANAHQVVVEVVLKLL